MGRQVTFFANQKDLDELFEFISSVGGIVINENGKAYNKKQLANITDDIYMKKYFRFPGSYIKLKKSHIKFGYAKKIKRKYIIGRESSVLELSLPYWIKNKTPDSTGANLTGCRLYQYTYYSSEYANSPEMHKLYDEIYGFIKKNYIAENRLQSMKLYMGKHRFVEYKADNNPFPFYPFGEYLFGPVDEYVEMAREKKKIKEIYNGKLPDASAFSDPAIVKQYGELLNKTLSKITLEDTVMMLNQKIFTEIAVDRAIFYLAKDVFAGISYEGELFELIADTDEKILQRHFKKISDLLYRAKNKEKKHVWQSGDKERFYNTIVKIRPIVWPRRNMKDTGDS